MNNDIIRLEKLRIKYDQSCNVNANSKYKTDSYNTLESINNYLKWYSESLVLFDRYFDKSEDNFNKFSSVDNHCNGYGLHDNYNTIYANYSVLLDKIKNMSYGKNNETKKIFIVHGSDDAFKNEVARFVESELGYNVVILHEQANSGRTLIEKLEKNTDSIFYAIILYTPCDEGRRVKKGEQLQRRARQNVIFEHGYLMGKIGREKTCMLYKEKIELPSDINGIVYSKNNNWKEKIRKELESIGNENKI